MFPIVGVWPSSCPVVDRFWAAAHLSPAMGGKVVDEHRCCRWCIPRENFRLTCEVEWDGRMIYIEGASTDDS